MPPSFFFKLKNNNNLKLSLQKDVQIEVRNMINYICILKSDPSEVNSELLINTVAHGDEDKSDEEVTMLWYLSANTSTTHCFLATTQPLPNERPQKHI